MLRFSLLLIGISVAGCSNQQPNKSAESKNKTQQTSQIKRRSSIAKKDLSKTNANQGLDQKKKKLQDSSKENKASVPDNQKSSALSEKKVGPKVEQKSDQSKNKKIHTGNEKKSGGVREFTPEELRKIEEENKPLPPGKKRLQMHLDYAVKGGNFTPYHFTSNSKIYSPILLEMVKDQTKQPAEIAFIVLLIGETNRQYNDAPKEIKTAHGKVLLELVTNKETDPLVRLAALVHLHANLDPDDEESRKKIVLENQDIILESFFKEYPRIIRQYTLELLAQLAKHEAKKVTKLLPRLIEVINSVNINPELRSSLVFWMPNLTTDRFDYVIDEFVKTANNESLRVHKWDIVEGIGKFKCEYKLKAKALFEILENHKDSTMRAIAAKTVAELIGKLAENRSESQRLVKIILKEFSTDDKEHTWGVYVQALGMLDKKTAGKCVPKMIELIKAGDDYLEVCLETFAKLREEAKDAGPVIVNGLEKWDDLYHDDALIALQKIGSGRKELAKQLPKILANFKDANYLFYTIGEFGPDAAEAIPTIVEYLSKSPAGKSEQEYIYAIVALRKLGKLSKPHLELMNKIKNATDPAYTTRIKESAEQTILENQKSK